jgi:hypothetical protein
LIKIGAAQDGKMGGKVEILRVSWRDYAMLEEVVWILK